MKFLLVGINSKFIHSNLAIRSLKANVDPKYRDHVEIAEYTINNLLREILSDIYRRHPDHIGFSVYIWNRRIVFDLLPELKKILPEVLIYLGGPEVSFDPEEVVARHPEVDGIMAGEGEEQFAKLVEKLESGFGGGKLFGAPFIERADGFCPPEKLEFPYTKDNLPEDRIIYYESQRGCPYRCAYCLSSADRALRVKPIGKVKEELRFFLENRVKQVKFVDRTFNCDHEHALAVWNFLLENDNGVTNFHFEVAGDILTEEELEVLSKMRKGLVQLEIGVQTVNEKTLEAIGRKTDIAKIAANVARIKEKGNIHVHLDLIAGLPYEDLESFKKSFDTVYAMKPDQLQLGFLKVLKGTPIERNASKYGIVYENNPPYEVLSTAVLSYDDIMLLKRVEDVLEAFGNSGRFERAIALSETLFSSPFALYEGLAGYYEEHGLFVNEPARIKRYTAFMNFIDGKFPGDIGLHNRITKALELDFDAKNREVRVAGKTFVYI